MKKKSNTAATTAETSTALKTTAPGKNGKASEKASNGKPSLANAIGADDKLDERELLQVLSEVRNGNFSVRMPIDKTGLGERFVIS